MANVGITYFSGTGNTWRIATSYTAAFEARGSSVELVAIEELIS